MYRVLLVDDEQIERMALAKKIDRYYGDKVDIYHAVNGREAVAMCSEQKNDIVILFSPDNNARSLLILLLWIYPCLK